MLTACADAPVQADACPARPRRQPAAHLRSRAEAERMMLANVGLAYTTLRRMGLAGRTDHEDLAQVALLALFTSALTWDEEGAAGFPTYAINNIRWRVMRELLKAEPVMIPANVAREERAELQQRLRPVSLSTRVGKGEERLGTLIPDRPDRQGEKDRENAAEVARLLAVLTPKERAVVEGRLRGELFADIGERIGVTKERARQLYVAGLERMRRRAGEG